MWAVDGINFLNQQKNSTETNDGRDIKKPEECDNQTRRSRKERQMQGLSWKENKGS